MGKEEFHWLCGVVQGWFSAKLGLKIAVMASEMAKIQVVALNLL
jgi:hypothetical protein